MSWDSPVTTRPSRLVPRNDYRSCCRRRGQQPRDCTQDFVTPGSRAGYSLRCRAWIHGQRVNSARPSGTSPGSNNRIRAIKKAPGSGREPNGSLPHKSVSNRIDPSFPNHNACRY
jgi:hypothetical protein